MKADGLLMVVRDAGRYRLNFKVNVTTVLFPVLDKLACETDPVLAFV